MNITSQHPGAFLFHDEKQRVVEPYVILLFFAFLALSAVAFRLPQQGAALVVSLFVAFIAWRNPVNGVLFIFLSTPFFLETNYRDYFFLIEIVVVITITAGVAHRVWERVGSSKSTLMLAGLLVAGSAASLPLDISGFRHEFWARDLSDMTEAWMTSHQGSKTYYLRKVFNIVTAVGIFAVTVAFWPRGDGRLVFKLFTASVVLVFAVSVVGLLMYNDILPTGGRYLSLSLVGKQWGVTAFAYNKAFFNQLLLLSMAMIMALVFLRDSGRAVSFALILVAFIFAAILLESRMRFSLVTMVFLGLIVAALLFVRLPWIRRDRFAMVASAVSVVAVALTIEWLVYDFGHLSLFATRLQSRFSQAPHDPRLSIWGTAMNMFTAHPIAGVGFSRFNFFFTDYFQVTAGFEHYASVAQVNAHSFYLQTLAEQGVMGAALWVVFVGFAVSGLRQKWMAKNDQAQLLAAASFGLVIVCWLFLAIFNDLSHIRILELTLFISLGGLSVFAPATLKSMHTPAIIGAVILCAGLYQAVEVVRYPVSARLGVGLYGWERMADGRVARWMRKRAVFSTKPLAGERELILNFSAPVPDIEKTPRHIVVTVAGETKMLTIADNGWKEIRFHVPTGEQVIVRVETDGVWNPQKAGVSDDNRDLGVYLQMPKWSEL